MTSVKKKHMIYIFLYIGKILFIQTFQNSHKCAEEHHTPGFQGSEYSGSIDVMNTYQLEK